MKLLNLDKLITEQRRKRKEHIARVDKKYLQRKSANVNCLDTFEASLAFLSFDKALIVTKLLRYIRRLIELFLYLLFRSTKVPSHPGH